jgi:hypothetical protein
MAGSTDAMGGSGAPHRLVLPVLGTLCALWLAFGASSALAGTPEATIDPSVVPGYTSVQAAGTVNPDENPGGVAWHFEITTEPSNPASWFTPEPAFGGFIGAPESEGTTPIPVAEKIESLSFFSSETLRPGTTYGIRLIAEDFAGDPRSISSEEEFTTKSVDAPIVSLEPITTKTATTAILKGRVDPNSPGGLDEAGEAAYLTRYEFQCSPVCPGLEAQEIQAEAGEQEVEVEAGGLEPNTSYEVTLVARNAGGQTSAGPDAFTTVQVAPSVSVGSPSALGGGKIQLSGTVNPHNSAITACRFDFGLTTAYGQSVPCEALPGSGGKPVFVTASLPGLEIGHEYHLQLVAANAAGPTSSSDLAFVASEACPNETIREEQHSTLLPECRAYELVNNPFKEGFVAIPSAMAPDGRLAYRSNGNFAENGNGSGGLQGNNVYLADRHPEGWKTTALAPKGPEYGMGLGSTLSLGFSPDLAMSIFQAKVPEQPVVQMDLYLRSPAGAFSKIGPTFNPEQLPPSAPGGSGIDMRVFEPKGASDDLSHYLFNQPSSPGWPGIVPDSSNNLYEYVGTGNERPRFVAEDNSGQQIGPGCESTLGSRLTSAYRAVSKSGRVVFFTAGCSPPSVWARIDGKTTIAVADSQCTRTAGDPGGACSGPAPATFEGANADGTHVFFTTSQQLVNGDVDESNDLYECDIPGGTPQPIGLANPCPDLRWVSGTATDAGVQGVVRISDDGSRVYFVATGVLASNSGVGGDPAHAGDDNLYVWERDTAHPDGRMTFVAKLNSGDAGLWGSEAEFAGRQAQTTDDGRYLLFASRARLIDHGLQADTDDAEDLYRYDADNGSILRVSTGIGGVGGNADDDAEISANRHAESFPTDGPRTALSADGRTVAFKTDEALSPEDVNGEKDVYVWHDGRVSLVSGGKPTLNGSILAETSAWLSPSGRDLYFQTTARLAANDVDTQLDIYDARIDGGFDLHSAGDCASTQEGCKPPLGESPVASAPVSVDFRGPGNIESARPVAKVKTIRGRTAAIRVTVPGTGVIKTAGKGTRSTSRKVTKAGSYTVHVRLSAKAATRLGRRHVLKTVLRVTFRPTKGPPATVRVPLTFRPNRGAGK